MNNNDIEFTLIVYGEKWDGWRSRISKFLDYLKTLPLEMIVVFIDGLNVIYNGNKKNLYEKFYLFDSDVVFRYTSL
jgi:hypothetical protein